MPVSYAYYRIVGRIKMKRFATYLGIVHLTRLDHLNSLVMNQVNITSNLTILNRRNCEMIEEQQETEQDDSIVIAVDSTLTRGGGILILPKIKQIYFYSLDWSKLEIITEASVAQLFNIALALELFEEFVDKYRNPKKGEDDQSEQIQSKLIFFTPNQLYSPEEDGPTNGAAIKNSIKKYHNFFIELEEKLKAGPFRGNLKHMNIAESDVSSCQDSVMRACANLAKENCTFVTRLSILQNDEKLSNYATENVSDSVTAMLALVSATLSFPK